MRDFDGDFVSHRPLRIEQLSDDKASTSLSDDDVTVSRGLISHSALCKCGNV
jgi:hypothetical protein